MVVCLQSLTVLDFLAWQKGGRTTVWQHEMNQRQSKNLNVDRRACSARLVYSERHRGYKLTGMKHTHTHTHSDYYSLLDTGSNRLRHVSHDSVNRWISEKEVKKKRIENGIPSLSWLRTTFLRPFSLHSIIFSFYIQSTIRLKCTLCIVRCLNCGFLSFFFVHW